MINKITLFVLVSMVTIAFGYSRGPPVDAEHPELCASMFPRGHRSMPQASEPPYKIVTSQNCYKDGSVMEVRIMVKNTTQIFKGFFVQARQGTDNTTAYGMFHTGGQSKIQTLDCFNQSSNAIGHSAKEHYWVRTFKWTAPTGMTETLHFQAVLVDKKVIYWMDVMSEDIKYNNTCTTGTTLQPAGITDIKPDDDSNEVTDPPCKQGDTTCTASSIAANLLFMSLTFAFIKLSV